MRNSSLSRRTAPNASVETTAQHMADAIAFLMRVATDAGLQNIALKLAGVRASLLATGSMKLKKAGSLKKRAARTNRIPRGI
ncbi:MAG: hypothetical protein ACLPKB_15445 [Xanthobacteraceae bacterium]